MIFMRSRWRLERALIALEYAFLTFLVVRSVSEAWSDVAIFLGPFRINPSVTIVALMDVLAVVYLAVRWLRRDPLIDRFGTLFLLWVLSLGPWVVVAAVEWGIPGLSGAREWFRLLSLVLIYLTVWSIARHRGPTRVINACLLALPVPLVITYYQILTFATGERAFGPMVHPNNLAAFLVIMIVLTAWKLVQAGPNWTVRGLWTGLLGIELIALIAPVSSNGWLMLAAFLVAVFVFAQGRAFKRAGVATMVAFGLILLAVFTQNPRIQSEIWGNLVSVGIEAPAGETTSSNLEGRLTMWRGLFADWTRQPILGYGLNSAFSLNPITGKAAHSDYIRYLVEAGAFGLLFFVVFQVLGALELCRWRRWLADRRAHLMMTFAFGAFLAWIVGSLADNLISYTVFHVYFWSFLACATAVATTTAEPKVDTSNLPREAPDSDPPLRPSKIQRPRSLRGWLAPAASIPAPNDALDGRPCVGCGSRPRSRDNILCPRCLRPLLSWPKRLGLFVVVQALVGLMGVYLWSQGAGIETFVLG
ncbi:MAG: O-antigen ligase family protein, partial [Salinibacter sp.]